ncbi:MAG: PDGLE domain-containing protein [Actinomycetota bacterium]
MKSTRSFVIAGLLVVVALVAFVAPWASSEPDGLERVAQDQGFADTEEDHALEDGPVAGYEVDDVENEGFGTALSGLLGVAVTFALGSALFALVRRGGRKRHQAES